MKSLVCVFFMIFMLVEVICCEGCWKQEREALIALNSNLGSAWTSWLDNTDCCQWEGIECNNTTGRVTKLKLESHVGPWQLNYFDFLIFKDLKTLDLSSTQISNCTGTSQGLKNLEVLNVGDNSKLDNATNILACLDGLSSLKSLSLSGNLYDTTSSQVFQTVLETLSSKMLHLEILDIGYNNLTNEILPSLMGFKSLKELYLPSIGLDSDLHIQGLCAILKNVEILDISYNNFNDTDIASAISGLSSLKSLILQGSEITLSSIHNISKLRSLEILDLAGNNLNLWPLENHGFAWPSSLQELVLRANSLSNNIVSSLKGLPTLESLDLSVNNLKGSLDVSGLLSLSTLKILDFSDNQLVDFIFHKGSKNLNRLDILDLDSNMINGSNIQELFQAFPSISNLTLRQNEFKGKILAEGFRGLSNLEYLALDHSSNIKSEFFKSIGDLPSLKVLSMLDCGVKGALPIGDWFRLKKLENLDLSNNEFVGHLPSSFVNMTSLRTLALTNNHFIGNIGPNLATFASLEYLNFEGNQFEFPISLTPFSNNSNLKFIYGNGNKVIIDSQSSLKTWIPKFQLQVLQLSSTTKAKSIPLPNFLLYQNNLTSVDFTNCRLNGEFPNWLLENNTKMETLILQNCSFIGNFHLPSRPRLNMIRIDVSNNAITGQMLNNHISSIFPNLIHLNMSKNTIHGSIPYTISYLASLNALDLSDNQLSGEIPHNISRDGSQLSFLRFSNNKLHGLLPPMLSIYSSLQYILLDGNNLSGIIPSNFFNSSNLQHLDISNNNFIGKIPIQIRNSIGLIELSMSNNHFEGSIPSELAELESLTYLDLSQNNLSGCVPSFVNSPATFIHLSNNKLSCLSKNMFGERSSLVTLDLSNNEIVNGFHDLVHDLNYTGVNILLLKGNQFKGNVPNQLCRLTGLNILDLSFNNFVGELPSCLGIMPFENKNPESSRDQFNGVVHSRGDFYNRFGKEKANFTSKKRSETYTTSILIYMSGIDLSHNKFNGNIPYELGNLTRIRALNLSNNLFTGKIPVTFSNLVHVESLDLSFNMLSGQIPHELNGLTSLEVFSVAHNNLSGSTPESKGQFGTFDESSYEGNQYLCGTPLPKSCNPRGQEHVTEQNGLNKDEDNDSWVDMYVFGVSFVVAYTSIVLVIVTVMCINPNWRQAWFYYIDLIGKNCISFIEDHWCKFF